MNPRTGATSPPPCRFNTLNAHGGRKGVIPNDEAFWAPAVGRHRDRIRGALRGLGRPEDAAVPALRCDGPLGQGLRRIATGGLRASRSPFVYAGGTFYGRFRAPPRLGRHEAR